MANNYTMFSCVLDVKTVENVSRAIEIHNELKRDENDGWLHSTYEVESYKNDTEIGIYAESSGNMEALSFFVCKCAAEFDLQGMWDTTYANTCSKMRTDGFDGGAILIDLTERCLVDTINSRVWLEDKLADANSAETQSTQEN